MAPMLLLSGHLRLGVRHGALQHMFKAKAGKRRHLRYNAQQIMQILVIGSTRLNGGEPRLEVGVMTQDEPCSPTTPSVAMARCVMTKRWSENSRLLINVFLFADNSDCSRCLLSA